MMSNHAHTCDETTERFGSNYQFHEPKHRGMSDEEFAAENWRRLELAVRR